MHNIASSIIKNSRHQMTAENASTEAGTTNYPRGR